MFEVNNSTWRRKNEGRKGRYIFCCEQQSIQCRSLYATTTIDLSIRIAFLFFVFFFTSRPLQTSDSSSLLPFLLRFSGEQQQNKPFLPKINRSGKGEGMERERGQQEERRSGRGNGKENHLFPSFFPHWNKNGRREGGFEVEEKEKEGTIALLLLF